MRAMCGAAALMLSVAVSGCGSGGLGPLSSLPESPEVAEAPWPRLVDSPPPIALTGESGVQGIVGKGAEIRTIVGDQAAELIRRDEEMRAETVVDPRLYRRAERLRARATAIRAETDAQ